MNRFTLITILASTMVVDSFTLPKKTQRRTWTANRRQTLNGGDGDGGDEPTVEQPLWRSPLRGMGGDYSNMEGVDVEKPIPVGYAPPPKVTRRSIQDVSFGPAPTWGSKATASSEGRGAGGAGGTGNAQQSTESTSSSTFTLRGMGGDYANMEGVSVATPLPVGYEYSLPNDRVETTVSEPTEDYVPPIPLRGYGGDSDNVSAASPAEKEIFIYKPIPTEDDVTVGDGPVQEQQQQEKYTPPTTLRGVGGDVGSMESAPPVDKPTSSSSSSVQKEAEVEAPRTKPLPVLKGMGGDYANMEGVYVDRPMPVGYAPPPKQSRRSIQDVGF